MFVCTKWLCELESLKRKKQGWGVRRKSIGLDNRNYKRSK